MEWFRQFSDSVDYIEKNLSGSISYEEAAKIAYCSVYYYQRMFSYVVGIPLSEYVRRRRMTQAAFDLQSGNEKVLDIGEKYGYTSPTSFNRAFQAVHGIAPSIAREKGRVLNAYLPINFTINVTGGEKMKYRIEIKDAIHIVGVKTKLTNNMEENIEIVPLFWDRISQTEQFMEICNLGNQMPYGTLGVSVYKNEGYIYYYIAVSTDKESPKGMEKLEIPAATWVVLECEGHFKESVQTMFKRFLTEWLPFSGYKYAELPDIEVYPVSDQQTNEGHSEIWIAIKKEGEEV